MKLKNGKIHGANFDSREYTRENVRRGDPAFVMSRSALLDFAACPAKWIRGHKFDDSTASTDWGSLIDCLIFDGDRSEDRIAVYPQTYPAKESQKKDAPIVQKEWNNNATFCKDWKAERAGKLFFTREEMDFAVAAIARLKEDEFIANTLATSQFQVYATAEYHDRKTGLVIPIKALIDILPPKNRRDVLDFKTARNASPGKWADVVNTHGYDVQAAMILDVLEACGEERDTFRHFVQENEPPFETARHELTVEFIKEGRGKYVEALKLYAQCLKTGNWPGYESRDMFGGFNLISPKAWMASGATEDPGWVSDGQKEAA